MTFDEAMSGVACDLDSRGFHVLCKATEKIVGHVKPYSITGSLPLIRELQVRNNSFLTNSYDFFFYVCTCVSALACSNPLVNVFLGFCRMKVLMFKLQATV